MGAIVDELTEARGKAELRQRQATDLREWAKEIGFPLIAIGDFNMDFNFTTMQGNAAFDKMVEGDVWKLVKPTPLVDTQWSDDNGKNRYPDSMLDFAFVSGPAKTWNPQCRVIVREGDFPDTKKTSDHRPIELRLTLPK